MWQHYPNSQDKSDNNLNGNGINNINMVNFHPSLPADVDVSATANSNSNVNGGNVFKVGDFDPLDSYPRHQRSSSLNLNNTSDNNTSFGSSNSISNDYSSIGKNITGFRDWHSEEDVSKRMHMTHRIMLLLQERKKTPCNDSWKKELPYKALKLERQLYKGAPSLKAYMDETTLKHRLRKVANAITTHVRLKKANAMQQHMTSSRPPIWNENNQHQLQYNVDPPVSQVTTANTFIDHNNNIHANSMNNVSAPTSNNNSVIDQTQVLSQMLEMQKTLNNLMKISSMNGSDTSGQQQQLQQQMLDMQNQLNQLSQQAVTNTNPTNFSSSFNGNNLNLSTNANAPTPLSSQLDCNDQGTITTTLNNVNNVLVNGSNAETTSISNNDEELDMEFLQETFGHNNNVAV